MTSFAWGGATHTGQLRSMNQDNLLTTDGLFAVADGMGGHLGGEVASERALAVIAQRHPQGVDSLVEAVRAANAGVHAESTGNPELRGMGTTLVVVARSSDGSLALANVGDSRVYLYRDGELKQLSEDHSLVESMVRRGQITAEAALTHPQRNVVLRALGVDSEVDLDAWRLEPADGDRLLLCSDGLFNEVSGPQIAGILEGNPDPQAAADRLVEAANEGGGRDNITVVVVDVSDGTVTAPVEERLTQVLFADAAVPGAEDTDDTTREVEVPVGVTSPEEPDDPLPTAPLAAVESGSESEGVSEAEPAEPTRSVLRTLAFLLAIILTFAVAFAGVGAWGRMSWFVGLSADDEVTLYQGRPGGFLWLEPTVSEQSKLRADDLLDADLQELSGGKVVASRADAQRYVANLEERAVERASTTTRPTTTVKPTTTKKPVPTTKKPVPTTKKPVPTTKKPVPTTKAPTTAKSNAVRVPVVLPLAPGAVG